MVDHVATHVSSARHVTLLSAGLAGHLAEATPRAAHAGHAVLGAVAGAHAPGHRWLLFNINGGFHSHGGTHKWMVYKGKSHENR